MFLFSVVLLVLLLFARIVLLLLLLILMLFLLRLCLLLFFLAQFVNYFAYSQMDRMLAYAGGSLLFDAALPIPLLIVLFVMVVGYLVSRSAPHGRLRSLLYVMVVAVAVIAVLAIKSLVSH